MAEQQVAPDRLDINGNPVAPDRLDAQGNPVYERAPDFKATAEIPTPEEFAAAKTPNQKIAVLQRTPVGQDLQMVKDLFQKWVAYGPHAVVEGLKDFMGGDYAKGAHEVVAGAGVTAAPMMAPGLIGAARVAPIATGLATAAGLGGGYVGQQVGERGATALGASPDQAALAGDVGGLLGGVGAVKGVTARAAVRPPAPPIQFAKERGIPLDAATVTDNLALKGAQAVADRSLGGSLVATPARNAQAARMGAVSEELAAEAHPNATTPEQAGLGVRKALGDKIAGHTSAANEAYDTLRASESPATQVNVAPAKTALRPIYDQMKRQMPITQQQANPGLKAIENILTGPDAAPLSQVDRDLSAIKTVAREQGGLAKVAVTQLDAAVTQAAKNGGPEVWEALQTGRAHTTAKYATTDVLEALHEEPVKAVASLTAPKDAAIQKLRTVTQQVPEQAPVIARAYLEDLLAKPNKVAEWQKLGTETKKILFPKPGQAEALDNFFALTKRISDTNVNPSGSGYVAMLGAQGTMLLYDPIHGIPVQVGGAVVAKLLRSPTVIAALTRGMLTPAAAPSAVRIAAFQNILKQAESAGVPLPPTGTGGQ